MELVAAHRVARRLGDALLATSVDDDARILLLGPVSKAHICELVKTTAPHHVNQHEGRKHLAAMQDTVEVYVYRMLPSGGKLLGWRSEREDGRVVEGGSLSIG
jgi:hypothetical protein